MTKIVDPDRVFVTSDLHFFHKNILKFQPNRAERYSSVEAMNETIVKDINTTVGKKGTLWHLGDLSFGRDEETLDVLASLDVAQVNLLLGNHDDYDRIHRLVNRLHSSFRGWRLYGHYHELTMADKDRQTIVLAHFPQQVWHKNHYGSIHLHGHCHGSLSNKGFGRRADAGWDSTDFGTPNRVHSITEIRNTLNPVEIVHWTHHRAKTE